MSAPLNFDPSFPPLLSGQPVLPPLDPADVAVEAATGGKAEAGDFFWSCDASRISYAIVLEPEVVRDRVPEMLFVAMTAMADAIGAVSPPELAITWRWPNLIYANDARVGIASLAVSEESDGTGAPAWIVVSINLALVPDAVQEPGTTPDQTTLWDEGAGEIETVPALESLARHFLTWVHRWESDGFHPVHEAWLFRCDGYKKPVTVKTADAALQGTFLGLDETGNLLLKLEEGGYGPTILSVMAHLDAGWAAQPAGAGAEETVRQ